MNNKAIKVTGDAREEVYVTDGNDWTPIGVTKLNDNNTVYISCWIDIFGTFKRKYFYIGGFLEDTLDVGTYDVSFYWYLSEDSRDPYKVIRDEQLEYNILDNNEYFIQGKGNNTINDLNRDLVFDATSNTFWKFIYNRTDVNGLKRYKIKNNDKFITFSRNNVLYDDFAVIRYISYNFTGFIRIIAPNESVKGEVYVINAPNRNGSVEFKLIKDPIMYRNQDKDINSPYSNDSSKSLISSLIYERSENYYPFRIVNATPNYPFETNNNVLYEMVRDLNVGSDEKNKLNYNVMLNSKPYTTNLGKQTAFYDNIEPYASKDISSPEPIKLLDGYIQASTIFEFDSQGNSDYVFTDNTNPLKQTIRRNIATTNAMEECNNFCYNQKTNVQDQTNNYLYANVKRNFDNPDIYNCKCITVPKNIAIDFTNFEIGGIEATYLTTVRIDPNVAPDVKEDFSRIKWGTSKGECTDSANITEIDVTTFKPYSGDIETWQYNVIDQCTSACNGVAKKYSNIIFNDDTSVSKCLCYDECNSREPNNNKSIETNAFGGIVTSSYSNKLCNDETYRITNKNYYNSAVECKTGCLTNSKPSSVISIYFIDDDLIFNDSGFINGSFSTDGRNLDSQERAAQTQSISDDYLWYRYNIDGASFKFMLINVATGSQFVIGDDGINSTVNPALNYGNYGGILGFTNGGLVRYDGNWDTANVLSCSLHTKNNVDLSSISKTCTGISWNNNTKQCVFHDKPVFNNNMTQYTNYTCYPLENTGTENLAEPDNYIPQPHPGKCTRNIIVDRETEEYLNVSNDTCANLCTYNSTCKGYDFTTNYDNKNIKKCTLFRSVAQTDRSYPETQCYLKNNYRYQCYLSKLSSSSFSTDDSESFNMCDSYYRIKTSVNYDGTSPDWFRIDPNDDNKAKLSNIQDDYSKFQFISTTYVENWFVIKCIGNNKFLYGKNPTVGDSYVKADANGDYNPYNGSEKENSFFEIKTTGEIPNKYYTLNLPSPHGPLGSRDREYIQIQPATTDQIDLNSTESGIMKFELVKV